MATFEIKILFWNVRNSPLTQQIAQIAAKFDVDVVLLAESAYWDTPADLLSALTPLSLGGGPGFVEVEEASNERGRVQIFSRLILY